MSIDNTHEFTAPGEAPTMHPEDLNTPSGDVVLYVVAAALLAPGFALVAYCLLKGWL